MTTAPTESELDPITFEVIKNSLVTVVDQMAEQILRTCYSFVIYSRDFSCCLCDADGNTVVQGTQDLAVHVGTLHFTAKAIIDYFGDDVHEGDVFMINDPYHGGTHFSDVRVIRPVFVDGKLISYMQVNGHWADVGGKFPGSYDVTARQFYGTGVRITPLKIVDKGVFRRDVADMIVSSMRMPDERLGDLHAQIEATAVGERELNGLISKYGVDTVLQSFDECQDYVERMTRARVERLPDGVWETDDYLDSNPGSPERMVRVHVKLTIDGGMIKYDLTGSDPPVDTIINGAWGSSFSSVVSGTKVFFPDIPLNSGFYRCMDVHLPENTVVNAPHPRAVDGFATGSHEKIMNSIFELWSGILPERALACAFNLEYLQLGGKDERADYDREYMWYDWMLGGWGGRHERDGVNGGPPVFGAGFAVQASEPQERLSPVTITQHQFLIDSAGPGEFRGGVGIAKQARLGESSNAVLSFFCDRARSITWGMFGGLPSYPSGAWLVPRDGERQYLGAAFSGVEVHTGDAVWRPSSGGGGVGDPLKREVAAVLEDVIDEYVSVERAAKDYGVVISEDDDAPDGYLVDADATAKLRDEIRSLRKGWLEEDPERVLSMWKSGEIDLLDTIRRYAVIIDLATNELLPTTTAQFREVVQSRSASFWDGE
jgi:N-methylhydantoinase B